MEKSDTAEFESNRLNPKLIRRAVFPSAVSTDNNSHIGDTINTATESKVDNAISDDSDTDDENTMATSNNGSVKKPAKKTNPRLHLVHNGKWIPKEYNVGRAIENTGIWNCCGASYHYSLYCDSLEQRDLFKQSAKQKAKEEIEDGLNRNRRKQELMDHISKSKEFQVTTTITGDSELTFEEQYMKQAISEDTSFNAPILVPWLLKHNADELPITQGLAYLLKHIQTAEGCSLVSKHGITEALLKIHEHFRNHPPIQLSVVSAFKQLLDCNYTRDELIVNPQIVKCCFAIGHYHMNSQAHVEAAVRCVTQCARFESNRIFIVKNNYLPYLLTYCERFRRVTNILRAVLKLINWISSTNHRMEYVCQRKSIEFVIKCLHKHSKMREIITPAVVFLNRACMTYPPALKLILDKKAVSLIIYSLKVCYDDDILQIQGLELLQTIAKTTEGWNQISNTRGGWQSVTQGSALGDALVHKLEGAFHNPGWCIGDTPYLPAAERQKQEFIKVSQSALQPEPTAAWTAISLREYMGLSTTGKTIPINVDELDVYFQLITTLDMLPCPGEEREDWFKRLTSFERESATSIKDMVKTIQDMRRRESVTKQLAEEGLAAENSSDELYGSIKPVFVLGDKITTESLEQSDVHIFDVLREHGIIE